MGISFNTATLLNGNGINVSALVSEILAPQTAAITALQSQQSDLSSQAGLLTGYNNDLNSLASAVAVLADPNGQIGALTATSAQPSIFSATAQTGASPATHEITVGNLASTGTVFTDPVASATESFLTGGATTGDIKLQVGGASGSTFDIPITQGVNDTLNTLANYINGQNFGVTASVVSDASGQRLAIFSQASGAPGALAITNDTTGLTFDAPVGGTNASFTVDGVPFSSATNTVTGAIPGVTLSLNGTSASQVQLTVGPDSTQAATAITNFVTAYNKVIGDLNTQFTIDPSTNTEGPLAGDTNLRSLQSGLLADANFAVTGNGSLTSLAALGINTNDDGTLSIDNTTLSSAFNSNPAAFQAFFQNSAGTGFANNFSTDLNNLTDPLSGVLNADLAGNATQAQSLTSQINDLQDNFTAQQQQLTTQYAAINATLESFPFLLQEVSAELGAISGITSGSSSTALFTPASPIDTTPASGTPPTATTS
jgi:flagellar hook-associated protein 2